MSGNALLTLLDRSVRWTGIPADTAGPPHRRPRRIFSTLALALAFVGFVVFAIMLVIEEEPTRWLAYGVLIVGATGCLVQPAVGPLKPLWTMEQADEFDRSLRSRSYLAAFVVLMAMAIIGLVTIVIVSVLPGAILDQVRWLSLALLQLLPAIGAGVPSCYASWAQPWPEPEED
ncbi:MAG: hypothetical protein A4S16_01425 [Proteobacteria bacterium SG_bin6]|nr:MAG: hypothetical protein A4S16_01425 [Proteobacteria bacterium SG_bin6]